MRWSEFATRITDHIHSPKARYALNFALDLIRPHMQALGLRISKLTDDQIEVRIPLKLKNQDSNQEIDEGLLLTAANLAFRILWNRKSNQIYTDFFLKSAKFERFLPRRADLTLKIQLTPLDREVVYADLQTQKKSEFTTHALVYDADEKLVSQIELTLQINQLNMLDWQDQNGNSRN